VAPVIAACIEQRSLRSVGAVERAAILNFALVQLFRTRAAREFAKLGSEQVLGQPISERVAQEVSLAMLLDDFIQYRACCESHIITLREAQQGERFLLGDGVTLIASTCPEPATSLRAALVSATIIVPICSTLSVMVFPPSGQAEFQAAGAWYRSEIFVLMNSNLLHLGTSPR
jgi:hypothetical protein